jgi:hypothetical protein
MNRFLAFFKNDKHLGKDALKFHKTFEVKVNHQDVTMVGCLEDMFPINTILTRCGGRKVHEYASVDEAITHVRHLCAINQRDYGYEAKEEAIDEKYPEFSKFWYRFSLGKEEKNVSTQSKELVAKGDVKTIGQLAAAKVFMEGMGFDETADQADDSTVQIESVLYAELKQKIELLRSP